MLLTNRFYIAGAVLVLILAAGHFVPVLFYVGQGLLLALLVLHSSCSLCMA